MHLIPQLALAQWVFANRYNIMYIITGSIKPIPILAGDQFTNHLTLRSAGNPSMGEAMKITLGVRGRAKSISKPP